MMELLHSLWAVIVALFDIAMHLDVHLQELIAQYQTGIYAILFLIVFVENGVVIWPFLPGDSLLFVGGTLAAAGDMDIATLMVVLIAAALTGDNVNYWIGRKIGPKIFQRERSRWFNPAYLTRAHEFYERHGGKTIILARFMPIIRTYAPFVAGIGAMPYLRLSRLLRRRRGPVGCVAVPRGLFLRQHAGREAEPQHRDRADSAGLDLSRHLRLAEKPSVVSSVVPVHKFVGSRTTTNLCTGTKFVVIVASSPCASCRPTGFAGL